MKYISILLLVFYLPSCINHKPVPVKTGREGEMMPSFKLLLIDSATVLNTKIIDNSQPTLLFYFGAHCPYSRAQMKEIIEYMGTLRNINIYALTTSPFTEMKGFYKQYELNKYHNIIVGQDFKNFIPNYFEAKGVPFLAIYGKDGKLRKAYLGRIHGKEIKEVAEG